MTVPTLYADPQLDAKIIQQLQVLLQTEATWIETVYPLALVGVNNLNDKEIKYPRVYLNNAGREYIDVRPSDDQNAFAFFELDDPIDAIQGEELRYNISLIVWYDLKKVDTSKAYDYSRELIQDIFRVFNESDYKENIQLTKYEINPENIFDKYSFKQTDNQFLMFPYGAFKISFEYNDIEAINCNEF